MVDRVNTEGVPGCVDCGCCCFSRTPEYVRVFGVDWERMDDRARSLTDAHENRIAMRMTDGRCAALVIDGADRTFRCSIYEVRPDVCRSLERGSGACRADRHEKAERPLLALDRLLSRRA
jgi:Fe-S-cluster containining protein